MSKCLQCYGSKVMMGGGMIQRTCDACDGTGLNLKSMAEEKAVDAICDTDKSISRNDAKKIYDDEFEKSKNRKRKK
jgi:hypothetical protein